MIDSKVIEVEFEKQVHRLSHQATLYDIYEGNLLEYVLHDLKSQLSPRSFEQARHRVAPINILRRVIDKLAKLYSSPPVRTIEPRRAQPMLEFYEFSYDINTAGGLANEYFNLFKNCALEPFLDVRNVPRLRVIPSDRFFCFSTSETDPMEMTHFVKLMGSKKVDGTEKQILHVYTDTDFAITDSKGKVIDSLMAERDLDGSNPYGKIPFAYQVRSRTTLNPPLDTDTLCMTKLFPILLTDINYATMFASFSVLYGIDIDEENLVMAPNAFWRLKSDPTTTNKPEIGSIKPEVDTEKVISLIQTQLAMWLQSKNIRPGSVGDASTENFASGISKMVDEMDTVEERQKQIPYFKSLEESLWDLTINHLHPVWSQLPDYLLKQQFPPGAYVNVEFKEQLPIQNRDMIVNTLIKELQHGLTTKKIAVSKLNPELEDDDIDEILAEVEKENTTTVETMPENDQPIVEEVTQDGQRVDEENS